MKMTPKEEIAFQNGFQAGSIAGLKVAGEVLGKITAPDPIIVHDVDTNPPIDDGWVSVEERLPEQKDFYTGCKIAYYRENYTIVVSSPNATLQCIESCIGFTPTHWYELPAKPCKHPQMTVEKYVKK